MRTIRWIFWKVVYAFRKKHSNLDEWILEVHRTWNPWKRFKPGIFHNEDGRQWEIYFDDEMCYSTTERFVRATVMRAEGDGRIVGLKIFDETITAPQEAMKSIA